MSGKVIIRLVKIICLVSIFLIIFFYQGQANPGCPPPQGSGGNPGGGCNPPGQQPPNQTDCVNINKKEDCNKRADCGWYQTAGEKPKCEGSNETQCRDNEDLGCVWDTSIATSASCKTRDAFCKTFDKQDKCNSKYCQWLNNQCQAKPPQDPPNIEKCGDLQTYCGNCKPPCNCPDATNPKCMAQGGNCIPKTPKKCEEYKADKECTADAKCKWDTSSGTGKCVPKEGGTEQMPCTWGEVKQADISDPHDTTCPDPTGESCCKICVSNVSNGIPAEKHRGLGVFKQTVEGGKDKLRILCCTGLYYNSDSNFPQDQANQASQQFTQFPWKIVNPTNVSEPKDIEQASLFCKGIWQGFNADIQAIMKDDFTAVVNSSERCLDPTGAKMADPTIRCLDVNRENPAGTTKHLFCCGKEQYLNTYLIKLKASSSGITDANTLQSAQAVRLPHIYWDTKQQGTGDKRKVNNSSGDNSYQPYKGPVNLKDQVNWVNTNLGSVCESCSINIDEESTFALANPPNTLITHIYKFYYDKIELTLVQTNLPVTEFYNPNKDILYYFFSDKKDDNQIKNHLRGDDCKAIPKEGQTLTEDDHLKCCWNPERYKNDYSNCSTDCPQCFNKLKERLYTRIKQKLEAICKNLDEGQTKCSDFDESNCKSKLECAWVNGKCGPFLPSGTIAPKLTNYYSIPGELEVKSDFFSSQKCGADK